MDVNKLVLRKTDRKAAGSDLARAVMNMMDAYVADMEAGKALEFVAYFSAAITGGFCGRIGEAATREVLKHMINSLDQLSADLQTRKH